MVAHGISSHVERIMRDSGSMMIQSDIIGFAAHSTPFAIGDLDSTRTFVHVLDDFSLTTLMQFRDTATDFVRYLEKREELMRRKPYKIFCVGEEELLGVYLTDINDKGEHDFIFPIKDGDSVDRILLDRGPWDRFINSEEWKRQHRSNEVSYMWDGLIQKIGYHALTATQMRSTPGGIRDTERVARLMASESRFERRSLAMSWMHMFENTAEHERRLRVSLPKSPDDTCYIFLIFPYPRDKKISEEEYREVRSRYLEACCLVAKKQFPIIKHIVAIATEPASTNLRSEDFGYLNLSVWSDDDEKEAARLQEEFQILVKANPMYVSSSEYPTKKVKFERNKPCPCGSKRKYKKCCIDRTYNW